MYVLPGLKFDTEDRYPFSSPYVLDDPFLQAVFGHFPPSLAVPIKVTEGLVECEAWVILT